MAYLAIVTALALLEYMAISIMVGLARGKYGITAPATSGNETFERTFRAHQNTLEHIVVFLPSLWLFGYFVSFAWGAGIGLLFIAGRALYVSGYIAAADKRGPGFQISFAATVVLLLGGLAGAIRVALSS